MKTGYIFDIKEFAVHDGPGIRQTVFLKGCPLRCNWCHNPEGLNRKPQLMVSKSSCIQCGRCEEVCRKNLDSNGICTNCGACIPVCPLRLRRLSGEEITSDDLVERIRKNSAYYANYGGGVTFSGGEPLMQADFLLEVLLQLPDLHLAIETSGYCESDILREMMKHLDYIMMDIKIFDSAAHKKYTGVDNQQILSNAKILCEGETPFVIRIPVIAGVNDNEENFRNTARWIQKAKALEKVELLPYHKTAGAKYSMIGKEYTPIFNTEEKVYLPQRIFEEYGIRSEVL